VKPDQEIEGPIEEEIQAPTESALLKKLVVLVAHRRLIVGGMLGAAILTAIVVIVMPVTYTATTVILTPQNASGSILGLLGQFGGLGSLASLEPDGLSKTPSDTYLSVLNSRTVADALIQRFQLQRVYRQRTLVDTRKALARHTHIESTRGSAIHISVEDKDVGLATAIANSYVEQLYRVNQTLALTSGAQRRLFLEQQLASERGALSQAELAFQEVERKTGVIQLAGQAEITLRSIAQLRAAITVKEVQLELLRPTATEQNLELVRLESEIGALHEQLRKAESNNTETDDDNYFVPAGKIPQAGLEYLRRTRDLRYHEALFEMLAKQYETARIDEAKAPPLIQVIDKAVAPDKRSWPPRTLLVLLALLTSGILLMGAVLFKEKWATIAEEPENAAHLKVLRDMFRHIG
jgi:tyrosine-protein kinase Etk/Wzc